MNIKGMQKTSLIDYPGKIASVIFLGGCNLMCGFCHNADLVLSPEKIPDIPERDLFTFLEKRKGVIEAVVISGGEPLYSANIELLIKKLKTGNFLVKVDTNGFYPGKLSDVIYAGADYVALDIKTSPSKYSKLTINGHNFDFIKNSLNILKDSGIDYEIRMTCVEGFCDNDDIDEICFNIGCVKRLYLQQFVPDYTLNPAFAEIAPVSIERLKEIKEKLYSVCGDITIRGITDDFPAIREFASSSITI